MFTGIVETTARVTALTHKDGYAVLTLDAGHVTANIPDGGSLAVAGACLTKVPGEHFTAHVMEETLARTNLGRLTPGDLVNVERPVPTGGRLDGHVVQGHVDGVGGVLSLAQRAGSTVMRVSLPTDLAPLIATKGSITLDGVSLTVSAISDPPDPQHDPNTQPWVEVSLIPATLNKTTLGQAHVGDPINIEVDVQARYAARLTQFSEPGQVRTTSANTPLNTIDHALTQLRAVRPIVVIDHPDRENEGDLIMPAATVTEEWMGFMVRYTSGVVCAPMTAQRACDLDLHPMVTHNEDPKGTAYTVSCDAATGVTTGISAHDRAHTARVLADPASTPTHLTRPGHMFPLIARPGGVRERAGHTEAGVEFARLAGYPPVAVIAELVHDDGSPMRLPALTDFAHQHGLALVSITDLITWLGEGKEDVRTTSAITLPTRFGDFTTRAWVGSTGAHHLTLQVPTGADAPLVRVHSECVTGDVFGSYRCDCGEQLERSLRMIAHQGGTLVYVGGHEGRGIGLFNKLRAYALQDSGLDTVEANEQLGLPADARTYGEVAQILRALGLNRIRLLTNNPAKVAALEGSGTEVVARVPLTVTPRTHNANYLATKAARMGHKLHDMKGAHV